MSETKMTKGLHLKLVEAFWDGRLEYNDYGLWRAAKCSPTNERDSTLYRIKPEPKLRPWKPEEVPLGAWYMHEIGGMPWFVDRIYPAGVKFAGNDVLYPFEQLAEQFHHAMPSEMLGSKNPWKPCGVSEEQP